MIAIQRGANKPTGLYRPAIMLVLIDFITELFPGSVLELIGKFTLESDKIPNPLFSGFSSCFCSSILRRPSSVGRGRWSFHREPVFDSMEQIVSNFDRGFHNTATHIHIWVLYQYETRRSGHWSFVRDEQRPVAFVAFAGEFAGGVDAEFPANGGLVAWSRTSAGPWSAGAAVGRCRRTCETALRWCCAVHRPRRR